MQKRDWCDSCGNVSFFFGRLYLGQIAYKYNFTDELLLQERNPGRTISMNNFKAGVYLVEVKTDVWKKFTKVIKQ
jgi:hypothetical protein